MRDGNDNAKMMKTELSFVLYIEPNPLSFGAAFSVSNAPNIQLTFSNMIFDSHMAYGGAAVYISQNSSYLHPSVALFNHVTVRNCQSAFGAIFVSNAEITIQNSLFANNTFFQVSGSFGNGGGVALSGNAYAFISNSQFYNNSAEYGGALYLEDGSYVEAIDSTFVNNVASEGGAAFLFLSILNVTRTNFSQNMAYYGGAVSAMISNLQSWNSSFIGNGGGLRGGAVLLSETAGTMTLSTQIVNNTAAFGGGICVQFQGKVNVTNSVITGNTAQSGGGLYISTGNWVNLTTTAVQGNAAANSGGGIFCSDSTLVLASCSITENTGPSDATNNNVYCSPIPPGTVCDISGDLQWAGLCHSVVPGSSDLSSDQIVWVIVGVVSAALASAIIIVFAVVICKRLNKTRPANIEDKQKHVWTALDDEESGGGIDISSDTERSPRHESSTQPDDSKDELNFSESSAFSGDNESSIQATSSSSREK
jgi:hypothetical protein